MREKGEQWSLEDPEFVVRTGLRTVPAEHPRQVVLQVHLVHLDNLENQENLDQKVHLANPATMASKSVAVAELEGVSSVQLGRLDLQDKMDPQDHQDQLELREVAQQVVVKDLQDHLDLQETLEHLVNQDRLDNQVRQARPDRKALDFLDLPGLLDHKDHPVKLDKVAERADLQFPALLDLLAHLEILENRVRTAHPEALACLANLEEMPLTAHAHHDQAKRKEVRTLRRLA